jgi:hypothetical protein
MCRGQKKDDLIVGGPVGRSNPAPFTGNLSNGELLSQGIELDSISERDLFDIIMARSARAISENNQRARELGSDDV